MESALKTKEKLIMSNSLIGTEPGKILALLADVTMKARDGSISAEMLGLFANGQLVPAPGVKLVASRNPLDLLVSRIERKLSKKLGRHIVPHVLPTSVTLENLQKWAAFNMQPIFLPEMDLTQDCRLPNKWVRPGQWYYDQIRAGKIGEAFEGVSPTAIRAGWYLADMSVGVDYINGTQVFPDDPWAPLFTRLREQKLIGGFTETPAGSRFAITYDEWIHVVLGYMSFQLGFPRANLRLERASEFNVIGNIYDPQRGKYNMWVWLLDPREDSGRLIGGIHDGGGLAHVVCSWRDNRFGSIAAYPLVSL